MLTIPFIRTNTDLTIAGLTKKHVKDATEIVGLTSVGRSTISALKMNRPQLTRVRKMWVKMAEHPPNI
jgi:hypothetical protein